MGTGVLCQFLHECSLGNKEGTAVRRVGTGVLCWLLHECSLWNKREKLHNQVSGNWSSVSVVSGVQPGDSWVSGELGWCRLLHLCSRGNKEGTVQSGEWELQ